ncbi:uncharacterized protein BJ212DRAFT_453983 [Suillus subaureus]|uniref:Uncharacterized protein n=1 Tax=Suillus subaureus TaxID=48587 RepID=A0A9P7E6G5_9AGAM|nr:uncharacterized protein BJ212DRAFT_453983 [Suillus subaureus]KAG1812506.1 hypothetical protein BJ212DRAFT_453983 [Suillus subaureus]
MISDAVGRPVGNNVPTAIALVLASFSLYCIIMFSTHLFASGLHRIQVHIVVFTATLCVHSSHVLFFVVRLYLGFTSLTQAPRTPFIPMTGKQTHCLISYLGFHSLASRIVAVNSIFATPV